MSSALRELRERRHARRSDLHGFIEYFGSAGRGSGVTRDLSACGVRVSGGTRLVGVGDRLRLQLFLFPGSSDVDFSGEVVRLTEAGFAVRFLGISPQQRSLLQRSLPDPSPGPPRERRAP